MQPCVSQIHNQTNTRIYDRNIPSQPLQPYLDVRPVMTKYSYLPIVDPRKSSDVPVFQQPSYNARTVFNPGNTRSPWSGFNVNVESELKNQVFALQKSSQAVYVPSSTSDLYQFSFQPSQTSSGHDLLFQREYFGKFDPNPDSKIVGASMFNNSTRSQIKEIEDKPCSKSNSNAQRK